MKEEKKTFFFCFKSFQKSPSINASLDAKVGHILIVVFITVTFHMVDRQTEYITRVDYTLELNISTISISKFNFHSNISKYFLLFFSISFFLYFSSWKQQLQERQKESECTKDTIKILVQNLLPAHVGESYQKCMFFFSNFFLLIKLIKMFQLKFI